MKLNFVSYAKLENAVILSEQSESKDLGTYSVRRFLGFASLHSE